jgi:hypothetical protein
MKPNKKETKKRAFGLKKISSEFFFFFFIRLCSITTEKKKHTNSMCSSPTDSCIHRNCHSFLKETLHQNTAEIKQSTKLD